jgi:glutamate 5-kinase
MSGQRIVVKFGTKLLCGGGEQLDLAIMTDLVDQVAGLQRGGAQVAIVSSGAVAAGRARMGAAPTRDIQRRQVLAAIGQGQLIERYDRLLRGHGLIAAQALLTRADLADRAGYLNARNTLEGLLAAGGSDGARGVIPIINENDVVAHEELRGGAFGENDSLSALVANLLDADLLVMLSDVAGLYDRDPASYPDARLIAVAGPDAVQQARTTGAAGQGRGGMRAKVEAAARAAAAGTAVVIAHGEEPRALVRIAGGESLGTRFPARATRLESRKRWLLSDVSTTGEITVDAGAVEALRRQGRSLLPAGITAVRGPFDRGDIVEVRDPDGARLGVGISDYTSDDVERIRGRRSSEITTTLGYAYGDEVIHRNNLALA